MSWHPEIRSTCSCCHEPRFEKLEEGEPCQACRMERGGTWPIAAHARPTWANRLKGRTGLVP